MHRGQPIPAWRPESAVPPAGAECLGLLRWPTRWTATRHYRQIGDGRDVVVPDVLHVELKGEVDWVAFDLHDLVCVSAVGAEWRPLRTYRPLLRADVVVLLVGEEMVIANVAAVDVHEGKRGSLGDGQVREVIVAVGRDPVMIGSKRTSSGAAPYSAFATYPITPS